MYSKSVLSRSNRRKRVPSRRFDKKVFSKTASGGHPVNTSANPMRGGIRL